MSEIKHKHYSRIDGVWQKKTMDYYLEKGYGAKDIEWCITEKIHGSNFAYYITANEIKPAKRNGFLAEGENFFQYTRMSKVVPHRIVNIWNFLERQGEGPEFMIVYGEIFGGNYPHPDVPNENTVRQIQKGVWYHPDINFYVFDIWLNDKFLDMDLVHDLCQLFDLFHAEILFRGTLGECLEYPNDFQTTIPGKLGLPEIENNICEGWVLKPVIPIIGSPGERIILKSKNDKFKEVEKSPKKIAQESYKLSEYAFETLQLIIPYINENRLNNVLSKHGEVSKADFQIVLGAFKKDIFEDFNINHDNLKFIPDYDMRNFQKDIAKRCVEVWRPVFLSLI
jgi:Rnl2 family RNA ligase